MHGHSWMMLCYARLYLGLGKNLGESIYTLCGAANTNVNSYTHQHNMADAYKRNKFVVSVYYTVVQFRV